MWDSLTGGDELDVVVTVDEDGAGRRDRRLRATRSTSRRATVPSGSAATARCPAQPRDGRGRRPRGRGRGRDRGLPRGRHRAGPGGRGAADRRRRPPEIGSDDVQRGDGRVRQPGGLRPGRRSPSTARRCVLRPRDFVPALSMVVEDGDLVPKLDDKALLRAHRAADADRRPGGAGRRPSKLRNGRPVVVNRPRRASRFDEDELTGGFLDVVANDEGGPHPAGEQRGGEAGLHHEGRAQARGSRRWSPSSPTYYPHADYRNTNLGRAAELVNGTLLRARRRVQPQRHRGRAHRGERLHQGLHHQRRGVQGGLRRRGQPGGHDPLQRDVLRRPQGHRAQAALVLHRPLPGGPRGHRRLAHRGPAVPERQPRTAC